MIEDSEAHEDTADASVEDIVPAEDRPTRGVAWLLVPLVFGVSLGTTVGIWWKPQQPFMEALTSEGLIGAGVGAVIGLLIWVGFPYKK